MVSKVTPVNETFVTSTQNVEGTRKKINAAHVAENIKGQILEPAVESPSRCQTTVSILALVKEADTAIQQVLIAATALNYNMPTYNMEDLIPKHGP